MPMVSPFTSPTNINAGNFSSSFGVRAIPFILSPVNNLGDLANLLFNDLRINEESFNNLNLDKIDKLTNLYHSTNFIMYKNSR